MLCSQERGPTAPGAGRPGQAHSSPRVWLFGTQSCSQIPVPRPWVRRETVRLILGLSASSRASKSPPDGTWGLQGMPAAPLCLEGQHICRYVCLGVSRGPCTGLWTCVPVRSSQDGCKQVTFVHVPAGMLTVFIWAQVHPSVTRGSWHTTHIRALACVFA